jgi:hypothetical protein
MGILPAEEETDMPMNNPTRELPADVLSFIDDRNFWAPTRTGDYAQDCRTGSAYGRELLSYMHRNNNPTILRHVCAAMRNEFGGVEAGFFQAISQAAIAGGDSDA